ncbi:MAG: Nif3-like dinuclear metal center hexameric protein [Planctomycetaceae bacterium]|nr:Nif3-like dinuclear metal center hexameric protein [Planctomycetaceae bacterium]
MTTIATIAAFLEEVAPCRLAEDWDNVGLLVGRSENAVRKVMTCLTVTPASAAEAIEAGADLIVTHHPIPFSAVKRLTDATTTGRLLLDLVGAGIAVFSAHTAFDSASEGINQRLAEGLELTDIGPLVPHSQEDEDAVEGAGRWGRFEKPITLGQLAERAKRFLTIDSLQMVGEPERNVQTVAVACGAAGEFLEAACQRGCDAMLVGETRFHTCLEAEASGVGLLLPGHFASERFALECLAEVLGRQFPGVDVWASRQERDPLRWV